MSRDDDYGVPPKFLTERAWLEVVNCQKSSSQALHSTKHTSILADSPLMGF